jgi:hypothetical protein
MNRMIAIVATTGLALSSCSPVMEANRPDPVDLSQFQVGQHRLDVVKVLGAPVASVNDGPKSCDVYRLYTHGPSGAGRAGIALVEALADVYTLGLAEVISTPVEAGTKNSQHTVTMCYSQYGTLLSIDEEGAAVFASAAPPAAPPAAGEQTPRTRRVMGINVEPVSNFSAFASLMNPPRGLIVMAVSPGGAASSGGMLADDVLLSLGTTQLMTVADVQATLASVQPNSTVAANVWRNGQTLTLQLGF